jgi:hypothetical protein
VGPRARLDTAVEKRKIPNHPQPGIEPPNPDRAARSQSLYRLSYHVYFYRLQLVLLSLKDTINFDETRVVKQAAQNFVL